MHNFSCYNYVLHFHWFQDNGYCSMIQSTIIMCTFLHANLVICGCKLQISIMQHNMENPQVRHLSMSALESILYWESEGTFPYMHKFFLPKDCQTLAISLWERE